MDKLKTVDEHNAERRRIREELIRQARRTGVACPNCGSELEWCIPYKDGGIHPIPGTSEAWCSACSLSVQLERW